MLHTQKTGIQADLQQIPTLDLKQTYLCQAMVTQMEELPEPTILTTYDLQAAIEVLTDTSSHGQLCQLGNQLYMHLSQCRYRA